jgi:hypothetical protein
MNCQIVMAMNMEECGLVGVEADVENANVLVLINGMMEWLGFDGNGSAGVAAFAVMATGTAGELALRNSISIVSTGSLELLRIAWRVGSLQNHCPAGDFAGDVEPSGAMISKSQAVTQTPAREG